MSKTEKELAIIQTRELLEKGYSSSEVAARLGIAAKTIQWRIKHWKLPHLPAGAQHGKRNINYVPPELRRMHTDDGYIRVYRPEHPYAGKRGYILEHRLVMEKMLGRYLGTDEVVHHKNHKRDDNREENLMWFRSQAEHVAFETNERHFTDIVPF